MPRQGPEPILPANDLKRTRAFYESLGFTAGYNAGDYEILRRGTLVVHLESRSDLAPATNRTSCYWRVDDADALYAEFARLHLPAEGSPSLSEPADEPWGMREFTIKDPAGNLIRVGHELAKAAEPGSRNLASISPFFIVKDLKASVAFYRDRLGFQLEFEGPPDGVYYAGVTRDGVSIMLKTIAPDVVPCPNRTRHPWARWDAYIYTLDPDTLFEEYRRRGVSSFVKELSFIDDGLWGFELTDADGYVLAFFCLRKSPAA